MKEMSTSINELSQMSKTGKSNHQMLTHAMAEFSSVELGSMTTSTYSHSACIYIGNIIHAGHPLDTYTDVNTIAEVNKTHA